MFEDFTWVKVALVIVASMFLQDVLFNQIVVFGSHPDLMIVLTVAAGILGGAEIGAVIGFFAGFAADLLVQTPFGLSAFVYVVVGYAIGSFVNSAFGHDFYSARVFGTFLGSIFATLVYALIAAIIGQPGILTAQLAVTVSVVGIGSLIVAPVVCASWGWALADMRRLGMGSHMPSGGSALR